jgi:hypothetical protein
MPRSVSSSASQKKGKRKSQDSSGRPSPSKSDVSLQVPPEEVEDKGEDDDLTKPAEESLKDGSDDENSPPDQGSSTHGKVNGSTLESDSDEAPEVISIVAGKRQIKQREEEIDNFAKA